MNIIKLETNYYTSLLDAKIPFSFARYGDGEWLNILKFYSVINADGCSLTPELGNQLSDTITAQLPYYYGILKIAKKEQQIGKRLYDFDKINKWLDRNYITMPWYDGDVMLEDNLQGKMKPFIQSMRQHRILYIGNEKLKGLSDFFDYQAYITTPYKNAHESYKLLLAKIYEAIDRHDITFIGYSAGMISKVLINEVYKYHSEITQVDFGSMWDGYFGLQSRSYIRKSGYDWAKLYKRNGGRG